MTQQLIEIVYTLTALLSIAVCIPQLRSLIRAKASDELNLSTWFVWTMAQVMTMIYVISIGSYLMAVVCLMWVSFYSAMVFLIVRYRYKPMPVMVTDDSEA